MALQSQLVSISFVLTCTLSACSDHDNHQHANNISAKALYIEHCASCHQSSGKGKFLKGIPPSKYTALNSKELVNKIRYGEMHQTNMQIFSNMDEKEAKKIALYVIRELKKHNESLAK